MQYNSTRDTQLKTDAARAIITGLAPDGGLFVPDSIEAMDLSAHAGKGYPEVASAVLARFLPEYDPVFLQDATTASYTTPFGGKAGNLVPVGSEGFYALELWHGPTCAFKDYALQLLPKLLVEAKHMKGVGEETRILVATSGDTGTAALNGFCDVAGTSIACFYPQDGTSEIQRLQMVTQPGENVAVYAVEGNFDDAQRGVKAAFGDASLAEKLKAQGVALSSANSINWGRLVPQVVYYVTSYLSLCEAGAVEYGQPVDFCVPTGNFGDIMAGYYAKALGLPVGRLICASNRNNVLFDFLETGRYDARRSFHKTSSPSMDILVSSNLERLLYHESGSDASVAGWMRDLTETGAYEVDANTLAGIRETFCAGWADEGAVAQEIAHIHQSYGYLCDPHTAVAFRVARDKKSTAPMVVLSTASPFKFSGKVLASLGRYIPHDEFEALHDLELASGIEAPAALKGLREKPVRFTTAISPQQIPAIPLQGRED